MRRVLSSVLDRLRTRLVPAVLTAAGIALIAAGLLSYTTPARAEGPDASDAPGATPTPTPTPGLMTFPPF